MVGAIDGPQRLRALGIFEQRESIVRVEYSSNKSGGDWWLKDDDWFALEKAGWKVAWAKGDEYLSKHTKDGRWLGCLAMRAVREGLSLRDAVSEWEQITGQRSTDAGCPCCGQPHSFTEYDDAGNYVASGPDASYECSWS